jgi:secondary thiamine-phosphate synthase enzyme
MESTSFEVRTGNVPAVADITGRVEQAIAGRGDGLAHVFVPHATAGLALIETGSGSERDLLDRLDALLPRDARYRHEHGAAGHGRDHLVPAFLPPALALVVQDGRLVLGRWQSLVLVDTNIDNPVRTVQVTFLPAAAPG